MPDLQSANVAVTGGSGFLGSHLLPLLIKAGANVSCLVRTPESRKKLPPEVRVVSGDCVTGAGLGDLLENQDYLIHMAGALFENSWLDYFRGNAVSAESLVKICSAKPRLKKIVYISSLAAAGPCAQAPGLAEDCLPRPVSAYGWSKLISENIFKGGLGNRLVLIRPPIIYGSGDSGLLPLFKSARMGLGVSPGRGKFPISVIHAQDAARAALLTLSPEAHGIYHLSDGQICDMDLFISKMGEALDKKSVKVIHVPLTIMAFSAAISSISSNLLGGLAKILRFSKPAPAHWNIDKYRESRCKGWLADNSRICKDLGFVPQVSLEDGMAEAAAGYRAKGLL